MAGSDSATILVVDDEQPIVHAVSFSLEKAGFRAIGANSAQDCMRLFHSEKPDLVVLDVMLPSANGVELCKLIRKESDVPIVMLTARTGEMDRVVGLEAGADDYVVKPFSLRELTARVKAHLRRRGRGVDRMGSFEVSGIKIDPSSRTVMVRGDEVRLSRREFDLLEILASNPDVVFSRDTLLDRVWGVWSQAGTRTVDVHIRWLREKIEADPSSPQILLTVRGVGYKMSGER